MFFPTRCFERDNEVININEYGFEYYRNNELKKSGLVEDLDATITSLIEDGFTEVI